MPRESNIPVRSIRGVDWTAVIEVSLDTDGPDASNWMIEIFFSSLFNENLKLRNSPYWGARCRPSGSGRLVNSRYCRVAGYGNNTSRFISTTGVLTWRIVFWRKGWSAPTDSVLLTTTIERGVFALVEYTFRQIGSFSRTSWVMCHVANIPSCSKQYNLRFFWKQSARVIRVNKIIRFGWVNKWNG